MAVAAAAALLLVSAGAIALFRPGSTTPVAPQAPVAVQAPADETQPEQRDEEKLLDGVLTRIDIEQPAKEPTPPTPAPLPEKPEPKPVVENTTPKPAPVTPPAPEPKEAVAKTPPPPTRPEDKTAPVAPAAPVVEPALPAVAVLDRVEGDVVAVLAGKRGPAASGTKLASGDSVETAGKTGQAVVEFSDGTRLVLGANTIVDSIRIADGKRVSLKQGVLAAQVAKQPVTEPMVFMTTSAEARVIGTRLTLSVTPSSTRLEVREGKVRLTRRDDGASVEVHANQVAQAGKGVSLTPKPSTTLRVALHETFDRRWGAAWQQGGEANLGMKMAGENGSLSIKTLQKPAQDTMTGGKMPTEAGELARKAVQNAAALATLTKKEWPRMAWLETRQGFPFSNETPLRIRTRIWNSHNDPDRVTWFAINRGLPSQGLALERRGGSLQLWVEGATAAVWKKDGLPAQEWETLELWISKDQMVVRRNEETLYAGANPLKVKAGGLSLGVNAKMELAQDEEVRFDDFDVLLTTRAELDEVAR
jgi:hypothetical protein